MSDEARASDAQLVSVYQSAALVLYTKKLAAFVATATDQQDACCFATATLLTAAAACEAILSEFVYITNLPAFTPEFLKAGVAKKYESCKNRKLDKEHPAVSELIRHRHAISHSEPNHRRSQLFGTRVNVDGARWAAQTVEDFARAIWGSSMPKWFLDTIR